MDWTKRAKKDVVKDEWKVRRIPITVSVEMQKLMQHFRSTFPDKSFSDTAILETLLEAGSREYYMKYVVKTRQPEPYIDDKNPETEPNTDLDTPVHDEDDPDA